MTDPGSPAIRPFRQDGPYVDYRKLSPEVAAILRRKRTDRGATLAHTAWVIGIDPAYLSRLERGLRAPRRRVAEELIRVLDLSDEQADRLRDEVAPEFERR